jgi:hypothetical protein
MSFPDTCKACTIVGTLVASCALVVEWVDSRSVRRMTRMVSARSCDPCWNCSQRRAPDTYAELPFVWRQSPAQARNASKDWPPAPIVTLVMKKPWLLANLYSGRIPHEESAA